MDERKELSFTMSRLSVVTIADGGADLPIIVGQTSCHTAVDGRTMLSNRPDLNETVLMSR